MDSIDKLLAEIKSEYKPAPNPQVGKTFPATPKSVQSGMEDLLAEVRTDFAQKTLAEEQEKLTKLKQEQIEQEQQRLQRLSLLKKRAEQWLKQLDHLSTEGIWFKDFAKGYPSELEAAIDYLEALS